MQWQRGFTLIELLVGMALVAVVMAIGVPSYKNFSTSSRVSGEVNSLLGDLQYARAEAIRQGLQVTVCAGTITSGCSGTATWSAGWIVYSNVSLGTTPAGNDTVLRSQAAFTGSDTVSADNSVARVNFNREGFITGLPANPVTITFRPANVSSNQWTRCLSIGKIGRLTVLQNSTTPSCV